MVLVASGWRPRLTAIPHWWVSWSLIANVSVQDGGDQITAVLALLLIPIALTDSRPWHWQPAPPSTVNIRHLVAHTAVILTQIQVSVLYFQASVAKLGVPEWADGMAMYYWLRHSTAMGLELALGLAILLPTPAKRVLLYAGITLHTSIALCMGLLSFGMAMTAALLLYLLPVGHDVLRRLVLPTCVHDSAGRLGCQGFR